MQHMKNNKENEEKLRKRKRNGRFLGLLKRASVTEMEEIVDPIGVNSNWAVRRVIRIGIVRRSVESGGGIGGLHLCHSNYLPTSSLLFRFRSSASASPLVVDFFSSDNAMFPLPIYLFLLFSSVIFRFSIFKYIYIYIYIFFFFLS